MNWTQQSPGIHTTKFEGWVITRISDTIIKGRVQCNGTRENQPTYKYIAAWPGNGERPFDRITGIDIDRVKAAILLKQVKTLF